MNRSHLRFEVMLLGIALLFLLVLAGFPLIYTLVLSFQEVDPFRIDQLWHEPVGWKNYRAIAADPRAWSYLANTALFLLVSVGAQFLIGLGLALLFTRRFFGSATARGLFLVTWIIPQIAVGIIWVSIFSQNAGVLNYVLNQIGMIESGLGWLTTSELSLVSVAIANVWLGVPFNMIFLTVGLMAIPEDMYEAARMDGAGVWNRFRFITLPAMRGSIVTVVSLGIIFTLQQFDLFAAMTNGGPAGSSTVLQYWSWELSFLTLEIGKGAAVACIALVFVTCIGALYIWAAQEETGR